MRSTLPRVAAASTECVPVGSSRVWPLGKTSFVHYTVSSSSRSTYAASLLSFAVVIADACMLERVIEMDTREQSRSGVDDALPGRFGSAQRGRGAAAAAAAGPAQQRDVEGSGGQFWYEAAGT